MDPVELVLILALVCYSIYRQTQKSEVVGNSRFKLAIIYAVVGLLVGGFRPPIGFWPILVLADQLGVERRGRLAPRTEARRSGPRAAGSTPAAPR